MAVILLVVGSLVAGVRPAAAGTAGHSNACTWLTGESVPVDVTVSGSAGPHDAGYLEAVTLSSVTVSGALPWWAATVAYELGLIQEGPNTIPITVQLTVSATNATPTTQTIAASTTASITFDPDLAFSEAGQAGHRIAVTNLAMPASVWTRTGQFMVGFGQSGLGVRATLGPLVDVPVLKDCFPAAWSTDDVPVATPVGPVPFASAGSTLANPRFTDVPYGHTFFLDIEWAAGTGVTEGYPGGTFQPTTVVSRQGFAAFLYRAVGAPAFVLPAQPTFPDVPTTHPFAKEIEWATRQGIISGYLDGTFKPTASVSRQAAAKWLMLTYADVVEEPTEAPFLDVPVDHPFSTAIAWLDGAGVTTGFIDGTFQPAATVSRQAAAAWFHRASGLEPADD